MDILELFCGTGSFSKVAESRGHKSLTVDINQRFKPSVCCDVRDFEAVGYYDVVWASPPCQEYSHAKRRGKRDIINANKNVLAALDIIKKVKPKVWIIENPQTGLLKNQPFMKCLPYVDASYCHYGMPYRKQTRFWTNLKGLNLKICQKDCNSMNGLKHIGSAGNGRRKYTHKSYSRVEKYAIPQQLCLELVKACENKVREVKG